MMCDPAHAQDGGRRGHAGEQSGDRTGLGPIDQLRQFHPIRLAAQVILVRRAAGDDQGIEIGGLQESGILIEAGHALAYFRLARYRAQRKQPQPHIQVAACLLEQTRELQLGGAQFGIGHVVEQADLDGDRAVAAAQQKLFNPAHGVTPCPAKA